MFNRAGKTLVILGSLLVVVSIVVVSIGVPRIIGSTTSERISTMSEEIASLSHVIDIYYEREGTYPRTLVQLVESGYLEGPVTDSWGVPYNYSLDRPKAADKERAFYVWTLGRDNRLGGDGPDRDVGNW